MRLRKNMKRAAAAALALSVALSAAAPAALAKDYYIENGDITVTVTEEGDTYVRVGEAKDKDDIGEKDDTDVVIKGGENPGKQTENNSDGSADEAEGQKPVVDAEPGEPAEETGTELVVWPENVNSGEAQKKDGPEPAEEEPKTPDTPDTPDTQKPEGKTDAANLEAPTGPKPVEEAADDDDDIMTYEDNTADTVTKAVSEAAKHIITIINNYTKKDTTDTIENVNIDVSKDNKAALSVKGEGDTTLKLEGDNTLKSGNGYAGVEKNDNTSSGKLTITADSNQNTLMAVGGSGGAGIGSDNNNSTSKLGITGGTITATGGNYSAGIGGGIRGNADVTITGNAVIKKAQGNYNGAGIGGGGVGNGTVTISGNAVVEEAVGGTSERGGAGIGGGGLEIMGIGVIDIDNHECMTLGSIQTPDCKTLDNMDKSLVDWYSSYLISRKDKLQSLSRTVVADAFFSKETFITAQATRHSTKPRIGTTGYQGARYCRSLSALPCCRWRRRNIKCEAQMLNHTATTAKPEIADSATNTVSGATTLENSASTPPSILTDRAVTGTPRLLTLAKQAGSVFSFDSDHSIRPEAYRPELAADRIAVRITKLKISAA